MDRALQRAVADACLGVRAGDQIASDLRGFLERHGVQADDVDAILAAPPRLAVYRSLVRNALAQVVLRMLPQSRQRLNSACAGRFETDFAAFADEMGPRTHYLRDVPAEFFAWARPRWGADAAVPSYLADLAAHELAAFHVAASQGASAGSSVDITLERPLAFVGSARLMHYHWAVHELPLEATSEPAMREVWLLAFRDDGVAPEMQERRGEAHPHAVRWLELTALAAAVVARLIAGDPLGSAVQSACAEHGVAPSAVSEDIARLLADLAARGVLLGARLPAPRP